MDQIDDLRESLALNCNPFMNFMKLNISVLFYPILSKLN